MVGPGWGCAEHASIALFRRAEPLQQGKGLDWEGALWMRESHIMPKHRRPFPVAHAVPLPASPTCRVCSPDCCSRGASHSSSAVLSIDRMENHSHIRRRYPRYHSSLFRGQPAWDPHTHVVLPLSVLSPPKAEGEHHLRNAACWPCLFLPSPSMPQLSPRRCPRWLGVKGTTPWRAHLQGRHCQSLSLLSLSSSSSCTAHWGDCSLHATRWIVAVSGTSSSSPSMSSGGKRLAGLRQPQSVQ